MIHPDTFLRFRRYSLTYADLAAAALSNDVELFKLPPGGFIAAVKVKHSASFTGGLIATYTVSVGVAGNLAKYAVAQNVFQAPGSGVLGTNVLGAFEDHESPTSIRAAAVSTVGLLSTATAGRVDIWVAWGVSRY